MGMHRTPIKTCGTSNTGQEIYPNCEDEEALNMVVEACNNLKKKFTTLGGNVVNKSKDLEAFAGCSIPEEVEIHPPNQSITKGSGKRIKGGKEEAMEQKQKHPRHCTACGQYAYHDKRNCPAKDQP